MIEALFVLDHFIQFNTLFSAKYIVIMIGDDKYKHNLWCVTSRNWYQSYICLVRILNLIDRYKKQWLCCRSHFSDTSLLLQLPV